MKNKHTKILFSVGEASADLHAANLVKQIQKLNPDIEFYGMGGVKMQAAGVKILIDCAKMAVVGLFEILTHLSTIINAIKIMHNTIKNNPPDLLIVLDYPGFNLRLVKYAKKHGIKVLYYISPQLWAWHKSRIKIIRNYVDHLAVILPFEEKFYQQENIPVSYVGHPLLNTVTPTMSKAEAKINFNLDQNKKIIGLAPGSRLSEIKSLLPIIIKSAKKLNTRIHNLQFILPLASSLKYEDINKYLNSIDVQVIYDQTYDALQVCDAIIATSGTVTLEIALLGIPLVIIYKMNTLTFPLAKLVVNIKYIGLCNIIADEPIAKELIQSHANPTEICTEIEHILTDGNYAATMQKKLLNLKNKMQSGRNLAKLTLKLLNL